MSKLEEGKKYISQIVLKVGDTVKDEVLDLKDGLQELKQEVSQEIEAIGKGLDE